MIPFVSHMPVYACSFPGAMTATWPHLRFDWWHARKTDARTRTSPSGSPRWLRMGWNWPKLRNMFWTCLERIGDMPGISPRANAKGTRERSWKHSSLIDPSWNLPEPPKARAGTRSHTGLRPLCQMLLGNENFLRYIVLRCLCSNSSVLVMHPVFGCPTLWQRRACPRPRSQQTWQVTLAHARNHCFPIQAIACARPKISWAKHTAMVIMVGVWYLWRESNASIQVHVDVKRLLRIHWHVEH